MRILINAVSIREGGPRVVLSKLLQGMLEQSSDHTWIVACGRPDALLPHEHRLVRIDADAPRRNPLGLMRWYELTLPHHAARLRCDVIFSMTNYLPLRPLGLPTVLLEQHAGHFSPEFEALTLANSKSIVEKLGWRYKTAWVHRSIRVADALVVQTQALADRIASIGLRRDNVFVVPHGPGQVGYGAVRSVPAGPNRIWRIGYISKFGVQKDFATLFRAAKILSQQHKLRLVLTLDPAYGPSADVLRACEDLGIGDIVENHGEVGQEVQSLYDGLDVMVFCSTCESFGFPMVEAMARGIPIVVADTPENREIVGSAGLRFRPHDENDLAAQLTRIVEDGAEFKRRPELSLARAHDFSWQAAARGTLSAIERTLGNDGISMTARQTQ